MSITRVQWRERQRLHAADLVAEQFYRVQAMGRHHLAPHDWGVVRGLWLMRPNPRRWLDWRVTEGVAIDGYGRELILRGPLDFTLPADAEAGTIYRVFLYYCESPSTIPPCAPCREDPAPRTVQFSQLVVSSSITPVTGDAADLSLARAAGTVPDASAWPVLIGSIALEANAPPIPTTRYHRQRASILAAPSGAVTLRQGMLGPDDRYHVLLSTNAAATSPERRLAVDRDGVVHVWKPLVLSGPNAAAFIALSEKAAMIVQAPMPIGVGRRIVLSGTLDTPDDPHLTLRWRDTLGTRAVVRDKLMKGGHAYVDGDFRFSGGNAVALRLVHAAQPKRRLQVTRRAGDRDPEFVIKPFSFELGPSGGRLSVASRTVPPATPTDVPCDPTSATPADATDTVGGVVYVRPAKQPAPAPTARAVQATPLTRTDAVPATVFNVSGGEFDDGDHSARVTIGARAGGWNDAVVMDGGGRVRMPADGTTLHVDHTLQLPPITTNPADPLTQDLLALAYNAGLRRVGRIATQGNGQTQIDVTISVNTNPAQRGSAFDYDVTITPGAKVVVKRVLELIVGTQTANNQDVALRSITSTVALPGTWPIEILTFQHRANEIVVALEFLLSVDGKDFAFAHVSSAIPVTG
jgi:hypothetical protein